MIATRNSTVLESENSYKSPFSRWNESSWIRSKPLRQDEFSGLPFSPNLVPLTAHPSISENSNFWITVLAYRLLTHLQFTTRLELNHVNPICSHLAQGQAPVSLTAEQQNDALRIYCDEAGHALFVELLLKQVEETFEVNRFVVGRPQFERILKQLITENQTRLSPNLIKLFFVTISETLVTRVLNDVPRDTQVSSVVRAVISDHAADEALHSVYFRNLFPLVWKNLSLYDQEEVGQLLPQLVWAFLGPDHQVEYNILKQLGFDEKDAKGILEEVYVPGQVAQSVRQAASPTLKLFESSGVFSVSSVKQAFENYELM
jgi:hypothetical protein